MTVTLRRRNGDAATATAEVRLTRQGMRTMQAFAIFSVALALGLGSIVIPLAHFITVWSIPLIGGAIAAYVYSKKGDFGEVSGACPKCAAAITLAGGPIEASVWRACPSCREPVEVIVQTDEVVGRQT